MKNVVIDTNVFVSALLKSKNCRKILDSLKQNKFNLLLSDDLSTEILIVLENSKFEFLAEEKIETKELLMEKSSMVLSEETIHICRDPKDDIVLECALAGKADFIVTGDDDLLSLKSFRKIRIITPRQFLKTLM